MTTKAYLVSWIGKGNIIWTPLKEQAGGGFGIDSAIAGPLRHALDIASNNSPTANAIQGILDPTMSKLGAIQSSINLASGLLVFTTGLQIFTLTQTMRIMHTVKEIDRKVSLIEGKFELHFMDRSLDFFLHSHENTTGLISPVASGLEEDCYNALQVLLDNPDLKIPAYLQLKLTSQAKSIELWNQMLYSVIHDGSLPRISDDRLAKWVKETELAAKSLPTGGYTSQESILEQCKKLVEPENAKSSWFSGENKKPLVVQALSGKNIDRLYPVTLLVRELQAARDLSEALEDKMSNTDEKLLLLKVS